ncbi:MAG: transglycosylase domain-containing protein [Candidatus Peribacteria bacterium]|nr:transglycosylase domain-containing protein [Candidatus Peribacteria bacterium]
MTEQYIKNEYFIKNKRTYFQKAREATLAFFFSLFHSKEKILDDYLQNIYFGNNIY